MRGGQWVQVQRFSRDSGGGCNAWSAELIRGGVAAGAPSDPARRGSGVPGTSPPPPGGGPKLPGLFP